MRSSKKTNVIRPTMKTRSSSNKLFKIHEPHMTHDIGNGEWRMSFSYSDLLINVDIRHSLCDEEISYTVWCWIDGERFRYETLAEAEIRHDLIQSNEQPFMQTYGRPANTFEEEREEEGMMEKLMKQSDDKHAIFPAFEAGIMERVEECLKRWDAICMLVSPSVSM